MGKPLKDVGAETKSARYSGLQFAGGNPTALRDTQDAAPPEDQQDATNSDTNKKASKSIIQKVSARETSPSNPAPVSKGTPISKSRSNVKGN
jgi:hypothetical protein